MCSSDLVDLEFNSNSSLNRAFEYSLDRGSQPFDLGARRSFSYANQGSFRQFGIVNAQSKWPDDFFAQKIGIDHFYRARKLQDEFVE